MVQIIENRVRAYGYFAEPWVWHKNDYFTAYPSEHFKRLRNQYGPGLITKITTNGNSVKVSLKLYFSCSSSEIRHAYIF